VSITSTKCSARFGYSLVGPNWLIMWFGGESLPTQFFLEWRSWRFQRTQLTHVICCGRNTVQRTYISLFYHWGGETLYTVSVSDYSWWKQVDSRTICWKQESLAQNPKKEKQYWPGNKPKNQPKKSRTNIVALIYEYDMAGRGARDETIIIWGRRQLWGRQENFYKKPKNSRNPSR
jgi:hypothetical protein